MTPIGNQRFLRSVPSQEALLNLHLPSGTSNAARHPGTAFPDHSSQPHEAPNANCLFRRALPAPAEPLLSLHAPASNLSVRGHLRPVSPPPNQPLPRRRPEPDVGPTAGPGAGRGAVGPEQATWLRHRVRACAEWLSAPVTERRGVGERDLARPARPPPLGLPLRPRGASRAARPLSGGRARPGVAVSTREAGLWGGRHGDGAGRPGSGKGAGPAPSRPGWMK